MSFTPLVQVTIACVAGSGNIALVSLDFGGLHELRPQTELALMDTAKPAAVSIYIDLPQGTADMLIFFKPPITSLSDLHAWLTKVAARVGFSMTFTSSDIDQTLLNILVLPGDELHTTNDPPAV